MNDARTRVMLYVQHLLGIGHLKRAMTLARALADGGLEVTVVSGGAEVPESVEHGEAGPARLGAQLEVPELGALRVR